MQFPFLSIYLCSFITFIKLVAIRNISGQNSQSSDLGLGLKLKISVCLYTKQCSIQHLKDESREIYFQMKISFTTLKVEHYSDVIKRKMIGS